MKTSISSSNFILRYNSKTVISPVAMRYLAQPTHALRPKIAHMYATRDRNTLWWRVSMTELLRFKRVVRSWITRRTRATISEALKERGFDREGRRIVRTGQPSEAGADANTRGLTGTLEVVIRPQCITEDSSTVQKEVSTLLDDLIERIRQQAKQSDQQQSPGRGVETRIRRNPGRQ
ncbi:hypothetical protein MAP00_006589 [Monascus purpureus]|nr:hypothetical protein MAP00_006589 [Monascus purpureus]